MGHRQWSRSNKVTSVIVCEWLYLRYANLIQSSTNAHWNVSTALHFPCTNKKDILGINTCGINMEIFTKTSIQVRDLSFGTHRFHCALWIGNLICNYSYRRVPNKRAQVVDNKFGNLQRFMGTIWDTVRGWCSNVTKFSLLN